ncbi:hypothetical protein PCANC_07073 [Puccinia coronata f. sp. avenae]|uniref:Uncharacterized protein n=1 Tax=Puccinia coronata f. sp. avenae TaxID=200324 RepID=A0A2N5VZM9_9BASI|nr:hypothetical protein PCANC_07073 [Puccinia coronata f. sp. avenae]
MSDEVGPPCSMGPQAARLDHLLVLEPLRGCWSLFGLPSSSQGQVGPSNKWSDQLVGQHGPTIYRTCLSDQFAQVGRTCPTGHLVGQAAQHVHLLGSTCRTDLSNKFLHTPVCMMAGRSPTGCVAVKQFGGCNLLAKQFAACNLLAEQVAACKLLGKEVAACKLLAKQVASCYLLAEQVTAGNLLGEQLANCNLLSEQITAGNLLSKQVAA